LVELFELYDDARIPNSKFLKFQVFPQAKLSNLHGFIKVGLSGVM
jgi:hypothetical protein